MPWALAFILGLALTLRLAGIHWGLPNQLHYFSYHPDEIFLLLPSFGFAQGDWNPLFFNYGTLYIYLVGLPAVVLGLVPDPASFPAGLRSLYLEGRIITALLGSATVLLLYLALRRESHWLALIAAAFLATCPLHVVTSHYATVDVPATFFLTLAFLFALRGAKRADARAALPVGLAVGLAAATKYNAGLFLLPALLAPLLAGQKARAGWWFILPAGALVGFF
ncbi:MAG: glycosyltransferase family 39 protein, partial [Armatimonadetes bacterium]|nr:glycosyltransferase family 39 protein [Armatimonadota bacterium]